VDHVAFAGAAVYPWIHVTAACCPGTVPVHDTIGIEQGEYANRESHELCAPNTDASWSTYPHAEHKTNPDGNA